MKFSIITPTFNSGKTLRQTIDSILVQSYQNFEYIIIDNVSTDDTLDIIREYLHRFNGKMTYLVERDSGIYDAMNKGIKMASGEIIAILNSDDFYCYNNVIRDVVSLFKNSTSDAVYSDLCYVSKDATKIVRKWVSGNYNRKNFKFGWMPPHPSLFLKKKIYDAYGLFRTDMKISNDYELMLRVFYRHKISCLYLNKTTTHMRVGGHSSFSFSNKYNSIKEDYIAWKFNGLNPCLLTFFFKVARKLFQYF